MVGMIREPLYRGGVPSEVQTRGLSCRYDPAMRLPRLYAMTLLSAALPVATTFAEAQSPSPATAGGIPVNYDEAKVGSYALPDPLVLQDGKPVRDAKTWYEKRRPEIVRLEDRGERLTG